MSREQFQIFANARGDRLTMRRESSRAVRFKLRRA